MIAHYQVLLTKAKTKKVAITSLKRMTVLFFFFVKNSMLSIATNSNKQEDCPHC